MALVVGTADGLHEIDTRPRAALRGHAVTALACAESRWWAILDGTSIWRTPNLVDWQELTRVDQLQASCLSASTAGLLVGTSSAHLFRLMKGGLQRIDSFEDVDGRADWHTPWGGPPDTRSIASTPQGVTYVNVHVGGIPRSTDGGRSWQPTIDIKSDIHQVLVHPTDPELVLAASAHGLAVSRDADRSWRFKTEGLHANYMRAVAVSEDAVLVSTSSGPRGQRAAIYRTSLKKDRAFERCRDGLPTWFSDNINTLCLAASGSTVALAAPDGVVFRSSDGGTRWERIAEGLPAVNCLAFG
jgi:hypothetical protein